MNELDASLSRHHRASGFLCGTPIENQDYHGSFSSIFMVCLNFNFTQSIFEDIYLLGVTLGSVNYSAMSHEGGCMNMHWRVGTQNGVSGGNDRLRNHRHACI